MTAVGDGVDGTAQAMKIDEFVAVFRHHAAGVAVVTAAGPDGPVAMTVTSLFSVSAEPPMFAFSASSLSSASPPILAADTVVAHILHGDNLPIGRLGAASATDRFSVPWRELPTGEPVYDGVTSWVRGEIVSLVEAGQSTLVIARALEGRVEGDDRTPLVYHAREWHTLGRHSLIA
ncbi:flavin reductase family protein [Rhodococcus sp. NPDC076796]|uniref:flavin reductase family protein n=1 Tax=Rhodococcus sp. NPDC076796 TaxID=3154859 RepID=UPI003450B4BA